VLSNRETMQHTSEFPPGTALTPVPIAPPMGYDLHGVHPVESKSGRPPWMDSAWSFGQPAAAPPVVVNVNVDGAVVGSDAMRELALNIRDELNRFSMLTPSLWAGR
jgi:hypothetical protein